jgi:hypothetical protein
MSATAIGVTGKRSADPAVPRLGLATTSFALSAAMAIVFNTLFAWAKDASPPLKSWMAHVAGHHWTAHGLADLVVFVGLGVVFQKTRFTARIDPDRLNIILTGAVVAATLGLVLGYLFF